MGEIADEYKTVCSSNIDEFDGKICGLLKDGWELYGNPYVLQSEDPEDLECLVQAMVRDNTVIVPGPNFKNKETK